MENSKNIRKIVREYIKENFLFGYSDEELKDDVSFFEIGALDSTGIMELVAFLEREFGISVLDEEIIQQNLDSIHLITQFVERKFQKN